MDDFDYEEEVYEPDEFEEAMADCCGHFSGGVFMCGAAGSEDCDFECPFSRDLGLTVEQIEAREDEEIAAELQADREARGNAEYDSWLNASSDRGAVQK
jgi:hypothetical protein